MRVLAIVAALLAAGPAVSQVMVYRADKDVLRLYNQPCPVQVHQHLTPPLDAYKAALATVGGQPFVGCWRPTSFGAVHLTYEDGDQGLIPVQAFKAEPGA